MGQGIAKHTGAFILGATTTATLSYISRDNPISSHWLWGRQYDLLYIDKQRCLFRKNWEYDTDSNLEPWQSRMTACNDIVEFQSQPSRVSREAAPCAMFTNDV
jgi:hypothetical protein